MTNLTVPQLVEHLVESGKLRQLTSGYRLNPELKKDFIQDLAIILLEYKNKNLLLQLHQNGRLDYFIIRIISNQLNSITSPYYKHYGEWENKRLSINDNI